MDTQKFRWLHSVLIYLFGWLIYPSHAIPKETVILMPNDHSLLREDAVVVGLTTGLKDGAELFTGIVLQNNRRYGGTLHRLVRPTQPFEVRVGYRRDGDLYISYHKCDIPVAFVEQLTLHIKGGVVILVVNGKDEYPAFITEKFNYPGQKITNALSDAICATHNVLKANELGLV